jgi:hypothetical protein
MNTKILSYLLIFAAISMFERMAAANDLAELKVLYVGGERTAEMVAFLKPNVAQVESRDRATFKPADADAFDVVVLDWPQTGMENFPPKSSPLGAKEKWSKPTVLLGSAGLNLAVVWKLKGGTGCTCMDPLAYGWRNHLIFEQPFKIDLTNKVRIPTPPDFRGEIKAPEIDVLPLVHDIHRNWTPGWCSYSSDFARNPDVEYFCGGVNHKTPTAAGLWRQGNLLHFGFEQSPAEMNETGQKLLLNSIAYISHFSEDRPIAVTPSVFAGEVAPPRSRADRSKEEQQFLYPDENQKLQIDQDLKVIGVPFDAPDFFDKAVAGLRGSAEESERARRTLQRYIPDGPKNASADQWSAWWQVNKPYAFASDSGDYRWYIDPLSKERGIPTAELRGPKRADASLAVTKVTQ